MNLDASAVVLPFDGGLAPLVEGVGHRPRLRQHGSDRSTDLEREVFQPGDALVASDDRDLAVVVRDLQCSFDFIGGDLEGAAIAFRTVPSPTPMRISDTDYCR